MLRIKKMRPWQQGVMFAEAIWASALFCTFAWKTNHLRFPQWLERIDIVDTVGSFAMTVAAPIAVGGWLMIWGDNGPPFWWLDSPVFNLVFGACFYAFLGGSIALVFTRMSPAQVTAFKLFVFIAVVITILGSIPLLWERFT